MKKLGTPKAVRNFFDGGNRRSEIGEFKEELNHSSKDRKKEALKKVIQAMTVGSDVSSLFPDVVNCMQTNSMDLKKLVYLYVINYAKAQPDLAILAIHSFRKDANDPHNPLLRALAVRTMGCIRLEQMTEYLLEPLRRSCSDTDPYVRKTATMCVAKLYDINPELVEDQGFLEILRDMLGDANPMVVANAVASLCEISASARQNQLKLDEDVISRLLPALNQCSEWGQVFILDALALYDPPNSKVAEAILEKGVVATLHHHNSAVVLSAIKVIMKFMDRLSSQELVRSVCRKMTPPLLTMLSAEPEIQYVVMRNINLIVQKQPNMLQTDVRYFVCKYNDPLYVKLEKIAVMVQLASERNIDQVLSEFREYASEVCPECQPLVDGAPGKKWKRFAMCPHRWKEGARFGKVRKNLKKEKKSYSHIAMVKRGERAKIKRVKWLARCVHGLRERSCPQCHGCKHGKLRFRCPDCRESCPHGHFIRHCRICSGCKHGVLRDSCKVCRGCEHGLLQTACRLCNACPHGRLKWGCTLCSQCPHGQRLRQNCPQCRGCPHGKVWEHCTQCNQCKHGLHKVSCRICHGCPHGKLPRFCNECKPCQHGKDRAHCQECAGCPHGKLPHNCKQCSGCPHGKVKRFCIDCNPCPHGKRKQNCTDCNTCEHGKLRHSCSECLACPHGKLRRFCATCNPCPHGKLKQACTECKACEHGKIPNSCALCNGCPHGKIRRFCGSCNPCPHGMPKQKCQQCHSCEHGKRRAACAQCNGCPHGKLRRLCAICNDCGHGKLAFNCGICKAAKMAS